MEYDGLNVFFDKLMEILSSFPFQDVHDSMFDLSEQIMLVLPERVKDCELFKKANSIKPRSTLEEVDWIWDIYNSNKSTDFLLKLRNNDTNELKVFLKSIIYSEMLTSAKLIVLLVHFEVFIKSNITDLREKHSNGIKDDLKTYIKDKSVSPENYSLIYIYAIVRVVFANTSNSVFDKRLPHRNDILHNGIIDYSDEEVDAAYTFLLKSYIFIDFLMT